MPMHDLCVRMRVAHCHGAAVIYISLSTQHIIIIIMCTACSTWVSQAPGGAAPWPHAPWLRILPGPEDCCASPAHASPRILHQSETRRGSAAALPPRLQRAGRSCVCRARWSAHAPPLRRRSRKPLGANRTWMFAALPRGRRVETWSLECVSSRTGPQPRGGAVQVTPLRRKKEAVTTTRMTL